MFEDNPHAGDQPGKKHLVIFKDDKGNVLSHAWMTMEEQREMNRNMINSR